MSSCPKITEEKIQIHPTSVSSFCRDKYERDAKKCWDIFYKNHGDRFFEDEHYLEKEWDIYFSASGKGVILEVGCGAGNTVFPLISKYPDIFVYACDFSPRAVELVKAHDEYREMRVSAFACDLTEDDLDKHISPSSVDIVTMIFVLSAVSPKMMHLVLHNIKNVLKPNGCILFRDYAAGDLAKLAFYFSDEFLKTLFAEQGFEVDEFGVNHSEEPVMNRRWVQATFRLSNIDRNTCEKNNNNVESSKSEREGRKESVKDTNIIDISDGFAMEMVGASPPSHEVSDKRIIIEDLKIKPDIIVSQDGTGNYKYVKDAIAEVPEKNKEKRFVIYIKKGIYHENVIIGQAKTNLTIVGDGSNTTIITGSLNNGVDHIGIMRSATLATEAVGFMAQDICFQNTAGPTKGQAVALRVSGDMSVIYRCCIDGYQDTLLADKDRQLYRDCLITGTIDFIFGEAAAVFQRCDIVARKPGSGNGNVLTAQGRNEDSKKNSCFTLQNCRIKASADLIPVKRTVKTFLGRPWKSLSRVVVMQCFIDDLVDLAGWDTMGDDKGRLSTLYYGEYENYGPGADTSKRVKWKGHKVITDPKEAAQFTVAKLIGGDLWLKPYGVPYKAGL